MNNNNNTDNLAKTIMLLGILTVTIFITGCTQGNSEPLYRIGYDGLVMEFSESNPQSVYEGEQFGTSAFIMNNGAYDVITSSNPAVIKITFDDYRLKFVPGSDGIIDATVVLHGKSRYYPQGEERSVSSYFETKRLTELREGSTTDINYNLCFPYVTEMTTMTCIDTKAANRDATVSACTSEPYMDQGGQGAPITITKIEPEIVLQADYVRPQFKIYIENKGTGYVTNAKTCALTNINDQYTSGRVNVRAKLSNEDLTCGPDESGQLRLVDGESFIRCYLPYDNTKYSRSKKNYITSLTVTIDYTYTIIDKQEVEIKRNDLITDPVSQGLCNSYQVQDTKGQCVSRCEYCSSNPNDAVCQENKPYPGFVFGQNFSCSCNLQLCDEKKGKGSCIKGYCPGDMYCCSTLKCDNYQVEFNGRCIDKCDYCSEINASDKSICLPTTFDFTGFTCVPMLQQNCTKYSANSACISGYCGGPNTDVMYCANRDKMAEADAAANPVIPFITSNVILNTKDSEGYIGSSSQSLCDYCANGNSEDPSCKFLNRNIVGRVIPGFDCSCTDKDSALLKNYQFVPEKEFCNNGLYCCNKMLQ